VENSVQFVLDQSHGRTDFQALKGFAQVPLHEISLLLLSTYYAADLDEAYCTINEQRRLSVTGDLHI